MTAINHKQASVDEFYSAKQSRGYVQLFVLLWIPLVTIILALGIYNYSSQTASRINQLQAEQFRQVNKGASSLFDSLYTHITHIHGVVEQFSEYAVTQPSILKQRLQQDLIRLSAWSLEYDQVRWIDETGMEKLRVDSIGRHPQVVPHQQLQDKHNRYYFTETMQLKHGEIYISSMDLNIENGQIELPLKPVLRVGSPLIDSKGVHYGIMVLNVFGRGILDRFYHSIGDISSSVMLLNQQGYRLASDDEDKNWGFMFDRDNSVSKEFPEPWAVISQSAQGQEILSSGLWTWQKIDPADKINVYFSKLFSANHQVGIIKKSPYFYVVSHASSEQLKLIKHSVIYSMVPKVIVVVLLLSGLTFWLAKVIHERRINRDHTSYLQTELSAAKALQRSEIRFHAVFDNSPVGIMVVNDNGEIVMANREFENIFGYSEQEVLGQAMEMLVERSFKKRHEQMRKSFFKDNHGSKRAMNSSTPFQARHKDGSALLLEIGLSQYDSGGKNYVLATLMDVRQRLALDEALRLSESRFRDFTSLSSDWAWEVDIEGKYSYVTSSVNGLLGYTVEEIIGKTPFELMPAEESERLRQAFSDIVLSQQPFYELKNQNLHKDGTLVLVSTSGVPIFNDDEELIGYRGVDRDITEACQNEKQLEAYRHSLEQMVEIRSSSLQRAEALAHVGSWHYEVASDTATWSEETRRILESDPDTPISIADFVECVHPEDKALVYESWEKAMHGDKYDFEHRILVNNKEKWVREMANIEYDEDGLAVEAHGAMMDITEQKAIKLELEQALAEAKELARAKAEFLANMSHEIRTPMNASMGLTQILSKMTHEPAQQALLQKMEVANRSLLTIINDILDFSKMEAGEIKLESRAFTLSGLLENLQLVFSHMLESKQLELVTETQLKSVDGVLGDELRIQQVLTNFLSNAIKFTESGKITIQFIVEDQFIAKHQQLATLKFVIADTGQGISAENQSEIFKAFSQADVSTTRQFGGTGLGLSICSDLAKLMDGSIGVNSELGKGSEFWFKVTLPVTEIEEPRVQEHKQLNDLGGIRILTVDDSDINLEVAAHLLRSCGASAVYTVESGFEALDFLAHEASKIDLILMDIQMPEMDGLECTRRIRQQPAFDHIPVIALSAGVLKDQVQEALDAGLTDFISKPIEVAQMLSVIGRYWQPTQIAETTQSTPQESTQQEIADNNEPEAKVDYSQLPAISIEQGLETWVNEDKYKKFLAKFVEQYASLPVECRQLTEQGDLHSAERLVHKLKGVAGNLGMPQVTEYARELNDLLRQQPVPDESTIASSLDTLEQELSLAIQSIGQYIQD